MWFNRLCYAMTVGSVPFLLCTQVVQPSEHPASGPVIFNLRYAYSLGCAKTSCWLCKKVNLINCFGCSLTYFRCRLWDMYTLNYMSTTLEVLSWREMTSGWTRTRKVEVYCSGRPAHNSWSFMQSSAETTTGLSRATSSRHYLQNKLRGP
jgi:hypothetical protein